MVSNAASIGRVKDLAEALGQVIKRHRVAAKLTHEKLAERADLHPNHISALERGERLPNVSSLIRIAEALDVPAWELLRDAQQSSADCPTS